MMTVLSVVVVVDLFGWNASMSSDAASCTVANGVLYVLDNSISNPPRPTHLPRDTPK